MINILDLEAKNILGFGIDGEVEKSDIERVWKALEDKLKTDEKLRFYIEAENFGVSDISIRALVEDFRLWLKNPGVIKKMEKVALVTDLPWLKNLLDIESSLFPALASEAFSFEEKERAMEWLKSEEPELNQVNIKWSELVEVGLLRSFAGIGVGLLAADLLSRQNRRIVGLSLVLGSLAVGLPISRKILKKNS